MILEIGEQQSLHQGEMKFKICNFILLARISEGLARNHLIRKLMLLNNTELPFELNLICNETFNLMSGSKKYSYPPRRFFSV